jgi:hypothetical protein
MKKRVVLGDRVQLVPSNLKTTEKTHLALLTGSKKEESESDDGLVFEGAPTSNLKDFLMQKKTTYEEKFGTTELPSVEKRSKTD